MPAPTAITVQHRLEAAGFGLYEAGFGALPLKTASDLGATLLRALGPLTSAHRTALNNLRLAFPEKPEAWRRDIARAMWADLGRTFAELPHMGRLQAYAENGPIEVVGAERLDAIKASGKGAVLISGHFSNWEVMAAAIVQRGVTCHVTYRPANNPLIDARIIAARQAYGVKLQAAKGKEGGMGLLRALARGETVALMNDQKYNEGVPARFFGHAAMTADGPARLALRFGVPLVPFTVRRLGDAPRFRVSVHPFIDVDRTIDPEVAIRATVQQITDFIEAQVREAPEQWFWVHRRWPKEAWR